MNQLNFAKIGIGARGLQSSVPFISQAMFSFAFADFVGARVDMSISWAYLNI